MGAIAAAPLFASQHVQTSFQDRVRETAKASGIATFYAQDLESDLKRFEDMPDETFLWVGTDSSSDALPLGVHPKVTEYLKVVLDSRLKQSTCKVFLVRPSAASITPLTPAQAQSRLKQTKPSYHLDSTGRFRRMRDGALMGVLHLQERYEPRSSSYTVTYRWEHAIPGFGAGFRDAVAYYESVQRFGMWSRVVPADG